MNYHHVVLFCFSSAVINGNAAPNNPHTKMEGLDFFSQYKLNVQPGSRIYLCRNDCRKEDILVETQRESMQTGRYRIRYDKTDNKVHVVITDLIPSDTGSYKVGVGEYSPGSYKEFKIKVRARCEEVVHGEQQVYSGTVGGNITIQCSLSAHALNRKFLCRDTCHTILFETISERVGSNKYEITYGNNGLFNVTITQLTWSDSGRYSCGVGRQFQTNQCQVFEITVTGAGGALRPLVCLTAVVLLVGCVLLLYKQRIRSVEYVNTRGSEGNPETAIYDDCAPFSTYEGSTYWELDPQSRDHTPYSTLDTPTYVYVLPSQERAQSSADRIK
ncbi:uncharacterized protein LOC115585321 isoform X2 [Sparus aurata]|uniref:uncharacterized protein LOC115585321 isoform X2 n=1 Tax=Sparus aurata TaxID=8175 RepID=UPI0011C119D6|nr:uncharacterized protein LOC115585321 isoform X2 [Sparus aurata]